MTTAPATPRAVSFFDGQNLYRHAKEAFGHHHPNYDPIKLTAAVCTLKGWANAGVRFYTGTPDAHKDPRWHGYWSRRLLSMRRAGILVTPRPVRYRTETVRLRDGTVEEIETAQEKGVDIRIALDAVRMARSGQLDVVLVFSQDQDLAEIVADIREIAGSQNRQIVVACAFPEGANASSKRGMNNTDWIRMDRTFYDACLDPTDYRPR